MNNELERMQKIVAVALFKLLSYTFSGVNEKTMKIYHYSR